MSTSRRRRVRFAAMTIALVVAATASLVIANILGQRLSRRFDATATREHRLSPRSLALVGKLGSPFEVVIAAPLRDARVVDRRALTRLADVLAQFRTAPGLRAGARIETTLIDTGSAAGDAQFGQLIDRLRQRDQAKIEKQTADIAAVQSAAEGLGIWLEGASPRLAAVRDAVPATTPAGAQTRAYLDRRAAECRASAGMLKDLVGRSRAAMQAGNVLGIPDIELAAATIRQPLSDLVFGLRDIAENLDRLVRDQGTSQEARDLASPLAIEVERERDRCALAHDLLERMPRLDITRIAKLLQGSSAALLIGPPEVGVTAIDLGALLPSTAAINAAGGADLGRNAEELIATALAALAQPVKPIVVLVHGQPRGYFERNKVFEVISQRLAMRGIDQVIWEAAQNPDPPSTTRLNPSGARPVVFVAFNADSPSGGPQGQTGPERATRLGRALAWVVDSEKPLLLSMFPSTLSANGEPDPTVSFLSKFGLRADTARPLLREVTRPTGREVQAVQVVRAVDVDHRVANAIRGLPTKLQWPIPMTILSSLPAGVKVTKLFEVDDAAVWGESQWLGFLQVPIEQHPAVPNPPSNDSERDDPKGPWILAAAAERNADGPRPQRLLAVGSNTWFTDPILRDIAEVDGRPVSANPGNAELFDAAVAWLAGQDDLIAQSPTARAVPLIGPLSGNTRTALRLLAIAGLPGLVLLTGLVWRLVRG